ncbi:hypothetical protein F4808DRAFT_458989 [Astrocystis sublimbata]|nr:hypothetical protein F4808DRAFT_458989 [Astrocystis sublimbata]
MAFWRGISENSISDHASNLLSTLSCFRSSAEFRPIIFIAHSLGGLVVMDALLSSRTSSEPHLRRILDCVRAILFLGTPHYGVALADTGRRLVGLVSLTAAKTNMKIVSVLQRDSEVLSRIQKGFHELLRSQQRDRTHALEITCCYEELPLIGNTVVVPRESAILRGYSAIGIHADHRGIARFASADDPGFISVLGELRRWTDKVAYADDHHDKELWDIEGKQSHDVLCGWECKRRGNDEGCRDASAGAITIWGDVTKSIIANGDHVIHGNLTFGGS